MYAIIKTGSKQYRVKKGDVIQVELIPTGMGEAVEFSDVLFIESDNGAVRVGSPTVSGSKVVGEYLNEVKGPKIQSVKYKRRKGVYRKFGHRQKYSQVRIIDIVG